MEHLPPPEMEETDPVGYWLKACESLRDYMAAEDKL